MIEPPENNDPRVPDEATSHALREWDGRPLAIDGELALIAWAGHSTPAAPIPGLRMAIACGGRSSCVVRSEQIAEFLIAHRDCKLVCHDAAHLHMVLEAHFEASGHREAVRLLWEFSRTGRLLDVMLLDQLLDMAEFGVEKDASPLAMIVKMRSEQRTTSIDSRRVHSPRTPTGLQGGQDGPQSDEEAIGIVEGLMQAYGRMRTLTRRFVDVYTGELAEEDGPLSLGIQVRGAIALDRISRLGGLAVDSARDIMESCDQIIGRSSRRLSADNAARRCFEWSDGRIVVDSKGFLKTKPDLLEGWLVSRLNRIESFNKVPFPPPLSAPKKTSRASRRWADWIPHDVQLEAWEELETAAIAKRLMSELPRSQGRLVRPSYDAWTRIRSSRPNLVSLRRMCGRPIFSAPSRRVMAVVELSDLELRCLADRPDDPRDTHMSLKRLFAENLDPVFHVAAELHGRERHVEDEGFWEAFTALERVHRDQYNGWLKVARIILRLIPRGFSDQFIEGRIREDLGEETNDLLKFQGLETRRLLLGVIFPELGWIGLDSTRSLVNSALSLDLREAFIAFSPITHSQAFEQRLRAALSGRKQDPELLDRLRQMCQDETMKQKLIRGSQALHDSIFLQTGMSGFGRVRGLIEDDHRRATDHLDRADDVRKSVLYEVVCGGYEIAAVAGDEFVVLLPAGGDVEGESIEEATRDLRGLVEGVLREFLEDVPGRCKISTPSHW